ncbi:hypothetical protein J3F83DRAFT_341185 [Trichoderma novae-zelandiae]
MNDGVRWGRPALSVREQGLGTGGWDSRLAAAGDQGCYSGAGERLRPTWSLRPKTQRCGRCLQLARVQVLHSTRTSLASSTEYDPSSERRLTQRCLGGACGNRVISAVVREGFELRGEIRHFGREAGSGGCCCNCACLELRFDASETRLMAVESMPLTGGADDCWGEQGEECKKEEEKRREKMRKKKKHANEGERVTLGACTPYPKRVWERGQKAKGQKT